MPKSLIGLSGTFASGKDTAAEYLVKFEHFQHVSTGDMIRRELGRRGLAESRHALVEVGNDLRDKFGGGVLVERALAEHNDVSKLVISGIRSVGEAKALKQANGTLVFIDAPIKARYERLRRRGRIGDETSFEQFTQDEALEMNSTGSTHQNIAGVRALADVELLNDRDVKDLFTAVKGLVARLSS